MDKYDRVKVVGRGAFGTVYLCRRKSDEQSVIMKQIPVKELSKNDRQAAVNEVKVLAMLHHPNIIEYYESFIHEQAMVIVMEYASGGTLHDYIDSKYRQNQRLEEAEVATLFAQMVLPLKMVHSMQIMHRDLKLQNIFLTRGQDQIKIGDFGLSKILTSKSKAISVVGTPSYISPELCEGKSYNQKSDIWALGCILYEMCTGQRAFEAPTLPALVLKIMRGTYRPISSHYSKMLSDFVASLLSVDPNLRPGMGQIMAHPWLAPTLYSLPTTMGVLRCTAKAPRPPSVTARADSSFSTSGFKSNPFLRHSGRRSPFSKDQAETRLMLWPRPKAIGVEPIQVDPPQGSAELTQLSVLDQHHVTCLTAEGKVFQWRENRFRLQDGLIGITITTIRVSADNSFFLLTDRGILLTFGQGKHGTLGHGDFAHQKKPKIVEALLGDEVVKVSCSPHHVCVLTSESEVFTWGSDPANSGCLGIDLEGQGYLATPHKLDLSQSSIFDESNHQEVVDVVCGVEASIFIFGNGHMAALGRNNGDRFGLWTSKVECIRSCSLCIRPGLSRGDVAKVGMIGHEFMIAVAKSGVAFLYGRQQEVGIDLGPAERIVDMAASQMDPTFVLATSTGRILLFDATETCSTGGRDIPFKSSLSMAKTSICCCLALAPKGDLLSGLFRQTDVEADVPLL